LAEQAEMIEVGVGAEQRQLEAVLALDGAVAGAAVAAELAEQAGNGAGIGGRLVVLRRGGGGGGGAGGGGGGGGGVSWGGGGGRGEGGTGLIIARAVAGGNDGARNQSSRVGQLVDGPEGDGRDAPHADEHGLRRRSRGPLGRAQPAPEKNLEKRLAKRWGGYV